MNWLVRGAHIVSPADGLDDCLDLLVKDGRIIQIGTNLNDVDVRVVKADGLVLMPGLVDLHAHLGEPGQQERETFATGSSAAARGGYTTVLVMPNTEPVLDNPPLVEQAATHARATGRVRLLISGALSKDLASESMPEFASMVEAGASVFSQPEGPVTDPGLFRRILLYVRGLVPFVAVQPHQPELSADGLMHEGIASTVYGMRGIPAVAETVAVAREILLAAETGCPVHLYQISTSAAVQLVAQAKAAGVPISCDVGPHHLVLTDEALATYDPACKLLPPLRPREDVASLVRGLAAGTIDCVSTNHTPLTNEESNVEFSIAPWGAVALETALATLFTYLVWPGHLTLSKLVEAVSTKPAHLLGLQDGTGTLRPGSAADFTLMDPQTERIVDPSHFLSQGRNTPLRGRRLRGWPRATFVDGVLVWGDLN